MDASLGSLTGATVELLRTMIRNRCVNDGTPESGNEVRNADTLSAFLESSGVAIERYEPVPGRVSIVARLEGSDRTAPSLCLMGHTDVVPVNPAGWRHDPFGGERITAPDGVDEIWGRGAVDMLNITASQAVAFRHLAERGFRPRGDLIFFAVADEESGSAHGARWMADHHRDVIRADYVLTENGGLHSGPSGARVINVNVGEKGVAWRRLRIRGTPGHGSMPFRKDNALVKAAAVISRITEYRPPATFTELWRERVETLDLTKEERAILLDPDRVDEVLDDMSSVGGASFLYSCTHTTFSCNVVHGGDGMKTNVIPDDVVIEVDVRTLPGESAADVEAHLAAALGDLAGDVEVEPIMNDMSTMSPVNTPLWDALQRSISQPFPDARLSPQMIVGFTDSRIFREMGAIAYGAGLMSPGLDPNEFALRFHGHDERIDVESLGLSTRLWLDVAGDLLG